MPARQKRFAIKYYPSYILLGVLNPFMYLFARALQGVFGPLRTAEQEMDDDAVEMARRGYRIARVQELETLLLRVPFLKVTYELVDPLA